MEPSMHSVGTAERDNAVALLAVAAAAGGGGMPTRIPLR